MNLTILKDHEVIDNKGNLYFHPKIIIGEFLEDLRHLRHIGLPGILYEEYIILTKKWEGRLN